MRPHALADVVGQKHLLAPGSLLTQAIETDRVRSMVLWGPPGSGKTTLAQVIAAATKSHFVPFSAVLGSVGELREIVAAARDRLAFHGQRTIVFVDEIHRFNKAQQDAFLPHVEDGTIVLVGATTENPSFAVNAALLSRCKVFRLEPLDVDDLVLLLRRALHDSEHGLGAGTCRPRMTPCGRLPRRRGATRGGRCPRSSWWSITWRRAGGGAPSTRRAPSPRAESHRPLLYDKSGEEHYNVVSAFIKSMRGSDPDAAIYWMMRMLEAGDDPLFVVAAHAHLRERGRGQRRRARAAGRERGRRRRCAASACPRGSTRWRRRARTWRARRSRTRATSRGKRAKELIEQRGALPVPMKLRNAVTPLMKEEGYGEGYKYAHDYEGGVVAGRDVPAGRARRDVLYEPTDRGEEARIKERLERTSRRRSREDVRAAKRKGRQRRGCFCANPPCDFLRLRLRSFACFPLCSSARERRERRLELPTPRGRRPFRARPPCRP